MTKCDDDDLRVHLLLVTEGRLDLHIPELGKHVVNANEWCLLKDLGPETKVSLNGRIEGIAAEIPTRLFDVPKCGLKTSPHKLACLICPSRNSAFFSMGSSCGRMIALAKELSKNELQSLSAVWMRQSYLAELVSRLLVNPQLNAETDCQSCCRSLDVEAIEKVAQYLRENLSEEHALTDLARRFFINECKLKQQFKEFFGCTVFGYLRQKRMEHARLLLSTTRASVINVANTVGYSNASHFARAFREVHALNPKNVRRVIALPTKLPERN